ncbi:hypothetical protein [Polyangium aurulentum]|uniref:hypothetical protein n=1 Tax=Polyangium aurulentum TaxID=2567896 RepID=UPI00146C24C9|nr:hypothetical protein [Polyangium aurulentum]UQA56753.1 hypothetical protein E8A73_036445 [Polyangium aurulentum]
MNTIRSTMVSAGLVLFAALGSVALSGCILSSVVGQGDEEEVEKGKGSCGVGGNGVGSGGVGGNGVGSGGVGGNGVGGGGGNGVGGGGGNGGGNATLIFDVTGTGLNPWSLTVDAANVYFTDAQGPSGQVLRVPLDGSPAEVLAENQYIPLAIQVDGADLYFMTSDALRKVPVAGGPVVDVAPAENAGYGAIATDATHVYWTNYTTPGSTMRIAKAGGMAETIASGSQWPSGLALRNGRVYWTALGDDAISHAPLGGGAAAVFASNQLAPRLGIAADDTYLYWLNEGEWPNAIYKAPLVGGAPTLVTPSPFPNASMPSTLVLDADHAYFGAAFCSIVKISLADGTTETLTFDESTVGCPMFLALDADNLYYTSQRGITKVAK